MKLARGGGPPVFSAAWQGVPGVRSGALRAFRQLAWAALLFWLGLGILPLFSISAAPAEPAAAAGPASYTFDLTPHDLDNARGLETIGVTIQRSVFPKEPLLSKRDVFRGLLRWGDRSEQAMPFIWDKGLGQLYLDLNRNQNLTDDSKGTFSSSARDGEQSFTNIHLVLPTSRGDRPVRLQVLFNQSSRTGVRVYAGMCSYWAGRVSLRGQEWQFGLVENVLAQRPSGLPEFVMLRPWAERQRPLRLNYANLESFNYTKNLFFGGQSYELDCRYVPDAASPKYEVTFKEQSPRLGELKVTGENLHRVILTSKPAATVILDQPQGSLKLPVGNYSLDEIWLRKGDVDAGSFGAGRLTIDAQHPTSLVAGGPLTNSVKVASDANALRLDYKLLGAAGRAYQISIPDERHSPEFAVFQGTNRVASGKFRYG